MAVVGLLLPGMIPTASTLMTRSAMPNTTTTHVGAVPASENGHNTLRTPRTTSSGRTVSGRSTAPSLSARRPTKLEP